MLHRGKSAWFIAGVFLVAIHFPLGAQEARWKELDAQVKQLQKQGKYAEAVPTAQEDVRVAETTFGPEHPKTASALNNLAEIYVAQAKYAEAEPLLEQSLAIRQRALGPDHPDVAESLNNLALVYLHEGLYEEAEPLLRRALAIVQKALGPEHPHVATALTIRHASNRFRSLRTLRSGSYAWSHNRLRLEGAQREEAFRFLRRISRASSSPDSNLAKMMRDP